MFGTRLGQPTRSGQRSSSRPGIWEKALQNNYTLQKNVECPFVFRLKLSELAVKYHVCFPTVKTGFRSPFLSSNGCFHRAIVGQR